MAIYFEMSIASCQQLEPSKVLLIVYFMAFISIFTPPVFGQESTDDTIRWYDYQIKPKEPTEASTPKMLNLRTLTESDARYYFVQFEGPITQAKKEQVIQAGGTLLRYVPQSTYIVRMNSAVRDAVVALPSTRWVGIFQPGLRMSRALVDRITDPSSEISESSSRGQTLEDTHSGALPSEHDELILTVSVFKGEDLDTIAKSIEALGGQVLIAISGDLRSKLRVRISAVKVTELAEIDGIMWIERFKLPVLLNNTSRELMNVPSIWTLPENLRGTGQIIAIADTGLDSGVNDVSMHDDFQDNIRDIFSWPVQPGAPADNVNADDGASDLDSGHGTHVAGSVLGGGTLSNGTYSGVAPEGQLVFQAVEQFTDLSPLVESLTGRSDGYLPTGIPADLNDLFQQAYDSDARIHSNSWGRDDNPGAYTDLSEDVDEFVWNHPDMLILFAAGNSGRNADNDNIVDADSISSPATAKNALTVGASENNRPLIPQTYPSRFGPVIDADRMADNMNGLAAFSSRGPTDDGRIKPDLVAPGTWIVSTRSQAAPNTVWFTDDMEDGPNGWTAQEPWFQGCPDGAHSGARCWHDSPGGNYERNADLTLFSPILNLHGGGLGGKTLQFWTRYELGEGDSWFLEASDDGGATWPGRVSFTGTQEEWELFTISLPSSFNVANFRMRFRLESDGDDDTGDGLYIDDVRIVEGAFGHSLLSDQGLTEVDSVEDQSYMLTNGTSMATPLTAGAAALVRQYYTDVIGLDYVSAALLRATLINGAAEMSPGQYGTEVNREIEQKPNNAEGWGRVNVQNSLFPEAAVVLSHVDEREGLETNETHTYRLGVTDTSKSIAVTMVYHDFPGAGVVNQLRMSVTTPSNRTLYPNGRNYPDILNNVKQIVIPDDKVEIGTYVITINGNNVPEGPQPYALVSRSSGQLARITPSFSCQGHCGDKAESCWCDELCTQYGDCCEDYTPVCTSKGCNTAKAPIFHGSCSSGVAVEVPQSCHYTYTKYRQTQGGASEYETTYKCQDGKWVLYDSWADGGSCLNCTPTLLDIWRDSCGGASDKQVKCY